MVHRKIKKSQLEKTLKKDKLKKNISVISFFSSECQSCKGNFHLSSGVGSNCDATLNHACYYIKWKNNNKFLGVDGSPRRYHRISVYNNYRNDYQKFQLTHKSNSYYSIDMMGYYLDLEYGKNYLNFNKNGHAGVILYDYHGGDNQLWKLEKKSDTDESYVIRSKLNEKLVFDHTSSLSLRQYSDGAEPIFEFIEC